VTPLSPDDFPAFFLEIHGYPPFPWQARLAREVATRGMWPDVLDLPTGSGKTAALDVAVFHLAISADRPDRAAPMRIAFVVDRRLVVDEAYKRAGHIKAALLNPSGAITRRVADALQSFAGGGAPLEVARLRGGVPLEDDWARTPCQPTILCSTVDQVGSRLMFRGYGVGDRMAPVHAGLLGSDALILLDEAHLSEPFRQTLRAITKVPALRGRDRAPLAVALLTATPGEGEDTVTFRLNTDDRADTILAARLRTAKPVSYREVADTDEARAAALAEEAISLTDRLRLAGVAAPIVGVIANRVGRARSVRDRLHEHASVLVIGRSRPIDRDRIAAMLDGLKTGRGRPESPLMLVGTQTLEAGIDVDLDGLVTEAAPLDSLRQRFGRVNRAGREIPAAGVVLGSRRARDADPIYGAATAATIAHLWTDDATSIDFGIDAMSLLLAPAVPPSLLAPRPDAPMLMPAYVTLWAQTSPRPMADPEPALFLHGVDREPASVQVVWRADLDLRLDVALLRTLLTLAPPRSGEVLELPIWAARQWLRGAAPDLADIAEPEGSAAGSTNRRAFRWAGPDDPRSDVIEAKDIRPGDLLVVPARHGGCDAYGWAPGDKTPVSDLFDAANQQGGGRMDVVRITAELMEAADGGAPFNSAALVGALEAPDNRPRGSEVIDAVIDLVPNAIASRLRHLLRCDARAFFPYSPEAENRRGVVIVAPRPRADRRSGSETGGGDTGDDATSSFPGKAQTLRSHTDAVERVVRRFTEGMGLGPTLSHDLALAASLHDAGKADPRFQRLLSDVAPFAQAAAEPLAKSAKGTTLPGAWDRAGLPPRWRHEALSVRLAVLNPRLQHAHDRALVLFLVGSHHGYGRPFYPHADPADAKPRPFAAVDGLVPPCIEAGAGPQSLAFVLENEVWAPTLHDPNDLRGLDWFTMIRELQERYGAWGLARLEAALRLADHRASAEGDLAP
jgi:CRISPR-associated endonuclease/helicase Cas3